MKISAILLAGGKGTRMGSALPKQFLPLKEQVVALYSLDILLQMKEIEEIVVVCSPEYQHFFANKPVKFAPAGKERQDSVYNGLQMVNPNTGWVCTHDSARPFITYDLLKTLFVKGKKVGAASLAMPVKNTLKEVNEEKVVEQTLDRSRIWEIQTPQLVKKEILDKGFAYAKKDALTVTDDVSLAELIGEKVVLVRGSYKNIKITTPEDLVFAQWLMNS